MLMSLPQDLSDEVVCGRSCPHWLSLCWEALLCCPACLLGSTTSAQVLLGLRLVGLGSPVTQALLYHSLLL